MKMVIVGAVCLVIGLVAGYLYGARYAFLESYRIGYDQGYYMGASDMELSKEQEAKRNENANVRQP